MLTFSTVSSSTLSTSSPSQSALARKTWRTLVTGLVLTAAAIAQPAFAAPADSMIKAVKFDDISAVKKLLAQGVDPNLVDNTGAPLLVIAAREQSDKVGKLLADN